MNRRTRSVVITGAALNTPAGNTLDQNSLAIGNGNSCFSPITRFITAGSPVTYAGECRDPDMRALPDRKVQKILRRKDIIALIAIIEAANSAQLGKTKLDPNRIGMYVGAGCTQIGDLTPYFTLVSECADLNRGTFDSQRFGKELLELVNPLVVLQTLMNNALCFGTMTLDIRGVNGNYMDFQVSGLRAIGEAFRSIADDLADIVIAGGVSGPVEPFQLSEGVHAEYLARTSECQNGVDGLVRPWDKNRCGTILSEGAGFLVLEERQHARDRGAKILGTVEGFGLANDGELALFSSRPSLGLEQSMEFALNEAGIEIDSLGGLIGHGYGSIKCDLSELLAYAKFFSYRKTPLGLTSPAGFIGDLCEASGPFLVYLAIDAMKNGMLRGTKNFVESELHKDEYHGVSISEREQKVASNKILVTSRNFFGLSAALVLGQE